jgi:hypothetical protein
METTTLKSLNDALTHDETYDLMIAARGFAAALDAMDAPFPDPDIRAMAIRLRKLADKLRHSNISRSIG